jgi:small nuclear ribonucleoprotein (snRNP)-like protein
MKKAVTPIQITATEILNYMSSNPVYLGVGKFTRVVLNNGRTFIGEFLRQDQTEELMLKNIWVLIQGGSNMRIDIDGEDIKSIRMN